MRDPQELEWHERVRRTLDFQIENANFFVWIVVQADPGASLDEDELRRDVEGWLGQLDADRVFRAALRLLVRGRALRNWSPDHYPGAAIHAPAPTLPRFLSRPPCAG